MAATFAPAAYKSCHLRETEVALRCRLCMTALPVHWINQRHLEIPAAICRSLGFDHGQHWLRFDELNRFLWPGYDLRPRSGGRYDYGMLPPRLFEQLRSGILQLQPQGSNHIARRLKCPILAESFDN